MLRQPHVKLTRDSTMFIAGLAAFVYEVASGGDRPNVLMLSGGLMGIAAYLRGIEAAKK